MTLKVLRKISLFKDFLTMHVKCYNFEFNATQFL